MSRGINYKNDKEGLFKPKIKIALEKLINSLKMERR